MKSSLTAIRGLGQKLSGRNALLGLLATVGFAGSAFAETNGRNPGSLLLYPEFDNRSGTVTVLAVTNVDVGEDSPDIQVEFIYIGRYGPNGQDIDCLEFNRTEDLTPGDNLTVLTNFHNPNQAQGFVYVFAKDAQDNPIVHDYLIGNVLTVEGLAAFEYSVNPVSYAGIGNGTITDLDGDGNLDMNGCEYSTNPDEILIPRFMGQGQVFLSELILIGLSGGAAFDTKVDFLIFNDNEEIFSSEHNFRCWDRRQLLDISGIFDNWFLQNWTDHDPEEVFGAPWFESGWIHIQGAVANSVSTSIMNPSVYAVLVERTFSTDNARGAADLPFERGVRTNGELFPREIDGDVDNCP
jgi:hypothetical protein